MKKRINKGVRRECIKAIKYSFTKNKGSRFGRDVLCELEEVKLDKKDFLLELTGKKRVFVEK